MHCCSPAGSTWIQNLLCSLSSFLCWTLHREGNFIHLTDVTLLLHHVLNVPPNVLQCSFHPLLLRYNLDWTVKTASSGVLSTGNRVPGLLSGLRRADNSSHLSGLWPQFLKAVAVSSLGRCGSLCCFSALHLKCLKQALSTSPAHLLPPPPLILQFQPL